MSDDEKIRVLMIGADRNVKGGISAVVNQYYAAGLAGRVQLQYLPTMRDGNRLQKLLMAVTALFHFRLMIGRSDLVHVHMSHRAGFYRKAPFIRCAARAGKKIIIHLHASEFDIFFDEECSERQKQKVRDIFAMADCVIALSEKSASWLRSLVSPDKISVLHNAVTIPDWRRTDYTDRNVLFLGRLCSRKGVEDLLAVIPEVLRMVPEAHFYLCGDGEVEACRRWCTEQNLEDSVTVPGWVYEDRKEQYLKDCSTFVLPSYHEGMPMAVLEAMSCGNVVVSTYVGGIPEVIHDGENGFLVEAGDRDALKTALIRALTDGERARMGHNAFQTVRDGFDAVKNLDRLTELYEHCLREED